MQLQCSFIVLMIHYLNLASTGVNYCGSKMCGLSNSHTFCQFSPGPGPDCKGFIQTELSEDEKSRILNRLNKRRSAAATGKLRGLPSAGDMLKFHWVDELAREAQLWAYQCRPPASPEEHDQCRDLYAITVGQCVASVVGEAPGLRIESVVDTWYTQGMRYTGDVIAYEPPKSLKSYYGDFAQMIWAHTYMVGCGRSRFVTLNSGRIRSVERLVCNFAPRGPTPARPLWTPATPAAACPPRAKPDKEFPALCAFQHNLNETNDVDKVMTKEEHLVLDTIMEIETNEKLNYVGIIDEKFLTKKAIETMGVKETNSIQKRDLNETIHFNTNVIINDNITELNKHSTLNITTLEVKSTTQRVVLIGRPKTYQIDELNDNDESIKKRESVVESHTEDKPHKDKELYDEYEEMIECEDNETSVEETTLASDVTTVVIITTKDNNTINIETTINNTKTKFTTDQTQSLVKINTVTENIVNIEVSTKTSTTEEIKDKAIEDYLSDPETVKQIQEELDRMERDLSTDMPTGKVRREVPREEPKEEPDRFQQTKPNKTDDTTPMLKMVMKYMPYLKDYQSSILHSSAEARSADLIMFCLVLFVL